MVRSIFISVFIATVTTMMTATAAPGGGGYGYNNNGGGGPRLRAAAPPKAPEITVHVIRPPPTFIYDVTQTAYYTEHHDCYNCPYVCGPTCIPQGEVLAPCNTGREIVVHKKLRKPKQQQY
ncbi:hypothetical protein BX661DRAFT_217466 [Kickxella alabastrina]|uniref:uncharacterized protein n=1 Tax=Kickxella alabastrina TaxID=61397 RepID=UPI00221F61BB|nr:uncharacterized protein BX661DRAFT_217466 [Kickxella alabastrina]KAI7833940.1 hypothetical protein BX661DRAFT_217466 [Kickxella alabastrina]